MSTSPNDSKIALTIHAGKSYLRERDKVDELSRTDSEMETAPWVLTHEDLRHTPRVRAFTDFAAEALRKYRLLLEGEHVPSNQLETRAPSNRRARVIELTAGASSSQSR